MLYKKDGYGSTDCSLYVKICLGVWICRSLLVVLVLVVVVVVCVCVCVKKIQEGFLAEVTGPD